MSKRKNVCTMKLTAPSGDITEVRLPVGVAFAAARGIIRDTHFDVELHGFYGVATFHADGSGEVTWGERSLEPGTVTGFGENTSVAL